MKKVPFRLWLQAVHTWGAIYETTKNGNKFMLGVGFEDLMITDGTGVVVNPFGYCEEFMKHYPDDGVYHSTWDRCRTCPLFPAHCGFNSIDGSAEYALIWQYVDAMRNDDRCAATEFSEKIFREILWHCPSTFRARLSGINVSKIIKELNDNSNN